MIAIINHPIILVLFFSVPITGYFLHVYLSKKALSYIFYTAAILFIPVIFGYYYVVNFTGSALLYITLTCGYALTAGKKDYNLRKSLKFSLASFLALGFAAYFAAGTAIITIEGEWNVNNYKIQHVTERGFSGGPLIKYELNKYTKIPIFITHVDSKVDDDSTHNCMVTFENEHFTFNKCKIAQGVPSSDVPSITVDTVNGTITTTSSQPKMPR